VLRRVLLLGLVFFAMPVTAEGLGPDELGVIYDRNDASSVRIAQYYARGDTFRPPTSSGSGPERASISREELGALRAEDAATLPSNVQSLLLVWSKPYAVECMSVTTAFAAGYQPGFCEPGCGRPCQVRSTTPADGSRQTRSGGCRRCCCPRADEAMARSLIERGIRADGSAPLGTAYLVRTQDAARNVRATGLRRPRRYFLAACTSRISQRRCRPLSDVLAYFTGVARVDELSISAFFPARPLIT
jgi:hypothetical protein